MYVDFQSFCCTQSHVCGCLLFDFSQFPTKVSRRKNFPENFNKSVQWVHLRRARNWWGKLGLPSDAFLKWKPNGIDGRFEIPCYDAFQAKYNKPENGDIGALYDQQKHKQLYTQGECLFTFALHKSKSTENLIKARMWKPSLNCFANKIHNMVTPRPPESKNLGRV